MNETEETPQTTRRTVLLGVGALGTVAALAACGTSSGGSGNPDTVTAAPTMGTGKDPGSGGAQSLGATAEIPVGGGKIFSDQNVVVTQPTKGTFKGFDATCTHQGCQVSQVVNGVIVCMCHGSQFSIVDGSVQVGPAVAPLGTANITVAGGKITQA